MHRILAFAALLLSLTGAAAGSVLSRDPEHVKVSADGTLGAVDGVWTGPPVTAGLRTKLSGHDLRVWKKGTGGA